MISSTMKGYTYDFNYSLCFENGFKDHAISNEEQQFIFYVNELTQYDMIKSRDIHQFYHLLSKQSTFIQLGKNIAKISQFQLGIVAKDSHTDDRLQVLRENLCKNIKEVSAMLGREKDYYVNLVVLFLMVIISKIISKKHNEQIERHVLFHLLHWEIKGQHSTSFFYETLCKDTLKQENIIKYIEGKSKSEERFKQSTTFKQMQSSLNANGIKNQNYVRSSFASSFNKQNNLMNSQFKPSLKLFKKIPISTVPESKLPKTFSNCNFKK